MKVIETTLTWMRHSLTVRAALLPLMLAFPLSAGADSVRVAATSNFAATMAEISRAFESETGHSVQTAYGSSGKLYAQMVNGAPFDVFFSADQQKPAALLEKDVAVPGTTLSYAEGKLVLWSSDAGRIDNSGDILQSDKFSRLAIANPRHAPYGAAAVQVLDSLNVKESTQRKLVYGENIAQTFHFVDSGSAELGLVALSQLIEKSATDAEEKITADARYRWSGSHWLVPEELYTPIMQDAILLKHGVDNAAAHALLEFLCSKTAQTIIRTYGYSTPGPGENGCPKRERSVKTTANNAGL